MADEIASLRSSDARWACTGVLSGHRPLGTYFGVYHLVQGSGAVAGNLISREIIFTCVQSVTSSGPLFAGMSLSQLPCYLSPQENCKIGPHDSLLRFGNCSELPLSHSTMTDTWQSVQKAITWYAYER
jgi:hypothetical protein